MNNQNLSKSDTQKQASYIKEQGTLHEIAAKNTIGGDAKNLNDYKTNYPTYDITSSTEIASVKSHMHSGTEPTDQDINAYVNDFHHMLGWGRAYDNGMDPVQQDAKNIMDARDQGMPVPDGLKGTNLEETTEYLKHNSALRIPDDHVESVQNALESRIRENPENYFLDSNPTNEQVQSVLNRVKGTGLNSAQTLDQLVDNQPSADKVAQENVQSATESNPVDSSQSLNGKEVAQSVGEVAGNVTAGPTGGEVGKAAVESAGQSTEDPAKSIEGAKNDNSSDEEKDYGYGYGY